MRWVNGDFDPEDLPANVDKLRSLMASASPDVKAMMVRVVNDKSGFLNDKDKCDMCYYLGDEDYANENFAMKFLVSKFLRAADAYYAVTE